MTQSDARGTFFATLRTRRRSTTSSRMKLGRPRSRKLTPVAQVTAPVTAPTAAAGPASSIPDKPLKAVDTLHIIITQKLKKSVDEVPLGKSIKDVIGWKLTLQNEILGDRQLEFGSAPEKGEELPLDKLASGLHTLEKYTSGLISRLVGSKMPGGFNMSSVKVHLSKTWGLSSSRLDAIMMLGLTMEPAKRFDSETEAKA